MKSKIEKVKLNNGVKIPALGIGTWQIPASEDLVNSLLSAIGLGYRYMIQPLFMKMKHRLQRLSAEVV